MHRSKEKAKRDGGKASARRARRPRLAPLFPLALLLAPWLTGCAHNGGATARGSDDPLVGGPAPPPPATAGITPPATAGTVPPMPVASSAASTASLASNSPLPGGRNLAIADTAVAPAGGNTWNGPGNLGNPGTGGTVLHNPEPVVPASRSTLDPVTGQTAPDGGRTVPMPAEPGPTYEQLQTQLTAKGITWYKQEKTADGIKFSCTRPSRTAATKVSLYEAVAPTELAALKAVLEKIDRE